MIKTLLDHYRCALDIDSFDLLGELSPQTGFFRFGQQTICYGRCSGSPPASTAGSCLVDLSALVDSQSHRCSVPFSPDEVIENLRNERYVDEEQTGSRLRRLGKSAYYLSRPLLPFGLRSFVKRISLRGWERKVFPAWPVDRTVEEIGERLMLLAMEALNVERIPFIWFWPNGHSGCGVMTHDVETAAGLQFCSPLMNLNESFGIKSSFQIIPGGKYSVSAELMDEMRHRGFEINVHDWNHDGLLFSNREAFLDRAKRINDFAELHRADGFRSGALYRKTDWYDAFTFSYDMSVPNVGHLDPQCGGCCTVMPYFIGHILEIPVTATQDYMLFNLLGQYSIDLWRRQAELILERNGLLSLIVHPDYVIDKRARATYTELLTYLTELRERRNVWIALPGEVNRWWRNRSQMRLARKGSSWEVEGPDCERACVAYALRDGNNLVYALDSNNAPEENLAVRIAKSMAY